MIIISNNPDKNIDPSNYDQVYYLGFIPNKELAGNEIVIQNNQMQIYNGYYITIKGITNGHRIPINKSDLETYYKKGINQIVLNERNTNVDWETPTSEKIIFIAKNGHRELEL